MLFAFINHAILRFMSRNGKQIMTEKEFTDIATELRELAMKKGRSYPLDNDEADDIAQDTMQSPTRFCRKRLTTNGSQGS